jgi:hypothetical protein
VHYRPPRPGPPLAPVAPRDALITVWVVVNLVNLLQAAGFATRVVDPNINRTLGIGIMVLGVPAALALISFVRANSGWRLYLGPGLFLVFVITELVVDYLLELQFRSPRRAEILIPYLTLFFGSIVSMGAPMLYINRRRWAVTAVTASILLGAMGFAMVRGVG